MIRTFEWKINNFMEKAALSKESPKFELGRDYFCSLSIPQNNLCFVVLLNIFERGNFKYNAFCKLCLIDNHGKEFIVTKRTQLPSGASCIPLMAIGYSELICVENELLSNDVLTLRLFWCEEDSHAASDIGSEEEPIKFLDNLSDDFSRLYRSKQSTDCVLKVGDAQFPVHRIVLSARSEVFAAMFHHDTSENHSGEVDIPDVDETALSYVLQYLYSGQIHGLTSDTAAPMYLIADKYAVMELKRACLDVLIRSLTVENVYESALLADMHGETDLEEVVVQFVKIRFEEIKDTDQWKKLLQTKPLFAVKLLSSALLADKK